MKIAAISIADYSEAVAGMPHDVERLYFRMILKMHSRDGGLPDDDAENARMFGYDPRTYRRLKAKLLQWPKAIYLQDGLLKNERVENDIQNVKERRAEAVENWRKGGKAKAELRADFQAKSGQSSANLRQISNHISHTTDSEINDIALASPSPSPSPSPEEKKEHCAVSTARRHVSTDEMDAKFEEFWRAFPSGRKKGKGKALALFRQIARGGHHTLKASPDELISAAKAYAATKPDPQYTPMPQTWLSGGRWGDELEPKETAPASGKVEYYYPAWYLEEKAAQKAAMGGLT